MRAGISVLFCLFTVALAAKPTPQTPIMPLSEVEIGMEGTWRTVVDGSDIEEFRLRILGVSPNFAGPNSPVIIAEAVDASQILSGPVGGMSGSPCYIDGKLVGAYAYGYLWPKEQAIIGITPIEEMLKVFEKGRPDKAGSGGRSAASSTGAIRIDELPRPSQQFAPKASQAMGQTPAAASGALTDLKPAPTPLMAAGISPRALDVFRPYAQAMGLDLMSAPSGTVDHLAATDIEPGSPVGGVLLNGDFSIVATGTCTWREGDDFLAFGHPFLQGGPVDIPVAPAEVITVVRSVPRSFKLANIGPIVGSIYQDRLTAVAGEVGRPAQLTDYAVRVTDPQGVTREYAGELFQNESMAPFIAALGLYNSASSTLETAENLTYEIQLHAEYDGYDPLTWSRVTTGTGGLSSAVFEIWDMLGMLATNPFEPTNLTKLTVDVKMLDERETFAMERLQLLSGDVKAGESVEFSVRLRGFRDESLREVVRAPIPPGTAGETLSLFIGDAAAADRIDDGYSPYVSTFGEMLDYFRTRRDNQKLYVKLLRSAKGYRTRGQSMEDLPPSARSLLGSSRTVEPIATTREVTLWETSIETAGAYQGTHRFELPVKE